MLEELERRNYSQSTARAYLMTSKDFARYFRRSPDTLGPEHIRQYQAYLFRERKLAANSVNQRVGALRFFFIKTLKKTWSVDETPYPKRVIRLPRIFSPEEVARLIDSATTPFYRTILMTLYATGVRRAELAHLKVSDIDSQRMVIHVQGGKGRKDRDIMLSPKLLEALREHWRGLKRKPKVWVFPGNRWPGKMIIFIQLLAPPARLIAKNYPIPRNNQMFLPQVIRGSLGFLRSANR